MMRESLERETNNTFQKVRTKQFIDIKPFKIKYDKDFYFVLTLNGHEYCYTKTREDAENLAMELKTFQTWNSRSISLEQMYDVENDAYCKIYPTIIKYAIKARTNGNYISTLTDNKVTFRMLLFKTEGTHIIEGIVYKDGFIYLPSLQKKWTTIQSQEALLRFVGSAYTVDWMNDNLLKVMKDKHILNEFNRLIELAEAGQVGVMHSDIEDRIESILYGSSMIERKRVLRNAKNELDQLIGLHSIKEEVSQLVKQERANRMLKAKGTKINNSGSHTLFIGSSGTKKTETARIYGDILYGLGLIKENKILEVSKEDLVSPYIGETEVKTKEILQRAKGGVLFVDEAYTLANDSTNQGNDYGKIALEIIMRAMENDRENLVVIFAGYEKEIES
jgi:hypothetical protein